MNSLLDNSLVGLVLLLSAGYALMALGPRALRKRLRSLLGMASSDAKASGGCSACDSCGNDAASAKANPNADIKVPVEHISRRR